jgi:hypothetical protein
MAKPNPIRVRPELAYKAIDEADQRTAVYTHYIILHYRATGSLAPGCDARDLYAWIDAQDDVPEAFKSTKARGL